MRILSIERLTVDQYLLWIEDGPSYKNIFLNADNTREELVSVATSEYKDYQHFAAVMGKFNPYTVFLDTAIPVEGELDFEEVDAAMAKLEKQWREQKRQGGQTNAR